jgi:predicted HTH domain antitoxin
MKRLLSVKDLIEAKVYDSEEAVLEDALRHLLRARPDLRLKVAIYRYQHDEISLAKAAHLAGVSWQQMRDILLEHGVPVRLGPDSLAEAEAEVVALRQHLA